MRPIVYRQKKGTICLEPGCDKYGDESMHYRCTYHYDILKSKYDSETSAPTNQGIVLTNVPTSTGRYSPMMTNLSSILPGTNFSATVPPRQVSRSAPMLPLQVEMYNVPEREPLNDLSRSASTSSITGTGTGIEHKYTQAMSKVERDQRSIAICKRSNCDNYGNSQKEGYCNSCFAEVQRQRLIGNATKPQYDDHYCC